MGKELRELEAAAKASPLTKLQSKMLDYFARKGDPMEVRRTRECCFQG